MRGRGVDVCGAHFFIGISRVNDSSHFCGKLEDRSNDIPVTLPAFHGVWIFFRPLFSDPIPVGPPLLFVGSVIHRLEVVGKGLAVFICHVLQGVADLMDNATLIFCLRKSVRSETHRSPLGSAECNQNICSFAPFYER